MLDSKYKLLLKLFKLTAGSFCVVVLLVLLANYWVLSSSQSKIFNDIEEVSYSHVALVLGTSSSVNGIDENPFFTNRITAAAELFFLGKIKHILVSGDNSSLNYNEPRDMRKALIKRGVPDSCITMDFAGLRTFDSIVRSNKIFQQKRITIVSQQFHNYRALFIAEHFGIDAVAYNAGYPYKANSGLIFREFFARSKAILDLYFLNTKPKFMGEEIIIRV
jgi:SanA protein